MRSDEMKYISQNLKRRIAYEAKKVCRKYGVKATYSVANNSTVFVCTMRSGRLDFDDNVQSDEAGQFMEELLGCLGTVISTEIRIGAPDKPYRLTTEKNLYMTLL